MPTRSISSKGPMRKPPSRRQMRSIVGTSATRSCSRRSASSPNGRLQRLTRKPGPSFALITVFPIASPVACASSSARSEDRSPATTSSRRMTGAGLKKCIPTTRSGWAAPAAIAVTGSEEVLVASTHCSPTMPDSCPNSSCLSCRRSGAASITSSHGASEPSSSTACKRASAASACARPSALAPLRAASLCSPCAIRSSPEASACGTGSYSSAWAPARAASWAIPAPIVPAPSTPITLAAPPARPASPALSSSETGSWEAIAREPAAGLGGGNQRVDAGHRPADDQFLDLRGALVQRGHAHVAEIALDRVVIDVAGAPVHLDGSVRALDGRLGRVQLGHRGLERVRAPAVLEPARPPYEHARGLRLQHHVGDHRLDQLEARDRAAELLTLLGVVDRLLHAALADAHAARRHRVAARVERR